MVAYITEKSVWAGPTQEKREELVGGTHPWLVVFCERCLWAGPTRGGALLKNVLHNPVGLGESYTLHSQMIRRLGG